jgi:uncharacterized protein (TIGR01777 family)
MNVLVTGASGLIGSALCESLAASGQRVLPLRRAPTHRGADDLVWDPATGHINLRGVEPLYAAVHLAGAPVARRWTDDAKRQIRDSRVNGTSLLCAGLAGLAQPPRVLVCASAIGFYGDRREERLAEHSPAGMSFLAEVCQEWEAAAAPAAALGIRVVHLRLGIVLSDKGGALRKMLPVFKLGLGGRVGDGQAWWSWIALDDVVGAIHHVLANDTLQGPVNVVSPNPVTNADFTKTLGRVLVRPTIFPVPRFAVEKLFGEMGPEVLLASARVHPAKLVESGFQFRFPELELALRYLLGK